MTDTKKYTDVKIKELGKSEMEITASIPAAILDVFYKEALTYFSKTIEIDGFRKGKVPEPTLIKHVGEAAILDKASHIALDEVYPQIIMDEKIAAIGAPKVSVKKLALGNNLEFTAITAVMPEVKLPDYVKIAKKEFEKEGDVEATNEDVNAALTNIKKERVRIENYEQQKKDGVEQPKVLELHEVKDEDLKDLDDEFVATLGNFKTVGEFEAHVKKSIGEEKKLRDKEKKRIAAMEEIIKASKIDLPEILVAHEIARMRQQFEGDLARMGADFSAYLKQVGKTEEEILKDWQPEAEKRAKLQLILNKIAADNDLEPNKEDVEHEVEHLLQHYPDADKGAAHVYVETVKRNEMVFTMLEGE